MPSGPLQNPAVKLGGFALVLALVFGGSTLAGRAIDPFDDDPAPSHEMEPAPSHSSASTTTAVPGADHEDGHP